MGHTLICRGHTASRRAALDIAIDGRARAAVAVAVAANRTQTHGRSASAAHAWIETLHARYVAPVGERQRLSGRRLCHCR